jgi:hypothetical protein
VPSPFCWRRMAQEARSSARWLWCFCQRRVGEPCRGGVRLIVTLVLETGVIVRSRLRLGIRVLVGVLSGRDVPILWMRVDQLGPHSWVASVITRCSDSSASSSAVLPTGWRWEAYRGVKVGVPGDCPQREPVRGNWQRNGVPPMMHDPQPRLFLDPAGRRWSSAHPRLRAAGIPGLW